MQRPPLAGVSHPLNIELIRPQAIDAGEWYVEFQAEIMRMARPVALHETVPSSSPGAMNVDDIVPLGRPDFRQEPWLQNVANDGLAGTDDREFFLNIGNRRTWGPTGLLPDFLAPFGHDIDPLPGQRIGVRRMAEVSNATGRFATPDRNLSLRGALTSHQWRELKIDSDVRGV